MPLGADGERRPADPMAWEKTVMHIATGEAEEVYERPPTSEREREVTEVKGKRLGNGA